MPQLLSPMKTRLPILLSVLSVFLLASTALAQWTNVGTGIDYQKVTITMADGKPNNLFMTRMAVANTNCIINSMIAANRVAGARERPSAMAARCDDALNYWGQAWGQRNDVIVAVNGSFEDANAPAGVIAGGDIYDGWYASRFGDWGGQMGLVWKFDRSYFIGVCPHYQASDQTVTLGGVAQTFDGINIPRINNLIIYTPQYNNNTLTDNSGVEVLVGLSTPLKTPSSTVTGTIEQVRINQGSTLIPFDHLVLSGAGSAATYLQTYAQVGQPVQISQSITLYNGPSGNLCSTVDSRNIINAYGLAQGNFNFLINGVVQATSNSGMIIRNPRTFLAYNSTYIFFVVCDGRSPSTSVGMTSDEMGAFCTNYLAATDAVNMDGGGSSVMVVNGAIKNSPSDGSERAVVNGLMMVNLQPKLVSPAFAANQAVTTSTSANLRLGPGTDYYAFTTVASGAQGTVVSHSVNGVFAKGYYWWKCNFSGTTGWVAESLLVPPTNAPSIGQQPTNQVMDVGGAANFTVVASGAIPLGYQWQKNTVNLSNGGRYSGCTNGTLTIASVDPTDAASYRCVVTNTHGTATSSSATLGVNTNAYELVTLTNIPPLSGDVTNEARAITPDGLWAAGVSGSRGFLYSVTGGNVYNVLDPFNAQSTVAAGVCYRTSGGQQQVIVGGMAAGWNADYCFTNGTAFDRVRRDNNYGSHPAPAVGIANLRVAGGGDVFWDPWMEPKESPFAAVGKVSGVWQGPSTTVATDKASSLGTTDFALYGISAAGRAVGYKGSSRTHFVVDWTGTGTPTTWSFNGLNGTTAGAAYAISTDGTLIFGQSPVSGGRSGSWPYRAVVTSASPGALQSTNELPGFADTVGTTGSAGVPYGCTADGKYAVGMSYRGVEQAVLWNLSDANPTNWTVTDLTHLAVAGGKLNIFSRLARACSVGTNAAGNLVIAGMGLDTNSPARTRAFVMTVAALQAPVVPRPTVTLSGSYPAGFTFSFPTVANPSLMYYLEYTTNLTPPLDWTTIISTPGTGTIASLPDPNPPDSQRFYRVRVQ